MKRSIIFIMGFLCSFAGVKAQSAVPLGFHPVSWHYRTERMGDKLYALHLTAIIKPGWHLYSQKQPDDAIVMPTRIMFKGDSLTDFEGMPEEVGRKEVFTEPALGISAWQYEGKVDFVQVVKLKRLVPVKIAGSIIFQTCREEECLPPVTKEFHLLIKE